MAFSAPHIHGQPASSRADLNRAGQYMRCTVRLSRFLLGRNIAAAPMQSVPANTASGGFAAGPQLELLLRSKTATAEQHYRLRA